MVYPSNGKRSEQMKIIGAGLPRTGTLSQKIALEMLGFAPCYHMVNVLSDLDETARWRGALDGDLSPAEIFGGFEATVDWPGSFFYRELMEIYPDAKVLLSVRDGDAWAKSMRETIWGVLYGDILIRHLSAARCVVDPQWRGYIDLVEDMWSRSGLMHDETTTMEWMSAAMTRYNAEVAEVVPADRLLVWSVSEGWEPLCEFLEVAVPEADFPRVNDSRQFGARIIDGALEAIAHSRLNPEPVAAGG
jgi:Sulfotransferase domain